MIILLTTIVDQPNQYAAGYTVKKWSNNISMVTERKLTENFKKTKPKIIALSRSGTEYFGSKNANNNIPFMTIIFLVFPFHDQV